MSGRKKFNNNSDRDQVRAKPGLSKGNLGQSSNNDNKALLRDEDSAADIELS